LNEKEDFVVLSESYINELKKWCDDLYGNIISEHPFASEFEEKILRFKTELDKAESVSESELYGQANQLYDEFRSFIEGEDDRSLAVPIGHHKLPPLPYRYNALEPYISEEIMRLHHLKHHQSYVDGLNKAEIEMEKARRTGDFSLIKHWEREAAFNGAGHYLHTIFWNVMNPKGGGEPKGELKEAIKNSFGSFQAFKKHFSEAAKAVEGGGWAILVWSPRSRRLEILQAEKHQNLSQWDVIPLLVLDVWEHAYYLQYKNDRQKYIDNFWKIVNWPEVEQRFQTAKKVIWKPY
jgi:Fe-Mn family superoxide dismutase